MQFDEDGTIIISEDKPFVHTDYCDEKPGIQAIPVVSETHKSFEFICILERLD